MMDNKYIRWLLAGLLWMILVSPGSALETEKYFDKNISRYVDVAAGRILVKYKTPLSLQAHHKPTPAFQVISQLPATNSNKLSLSGKIPAAKVDTLLNAYQQDPAVEYAEPDYILELCATPNDPDLYKQWALQTIKAPLAWDISTGANNVAIAIIDAAVDITHPDLAAKVWTNPREISGNDLDDDNNGYRDDLHGWDFAANSPTSDYADDHGTHVAGIAAAATNNGQGIAGTSWDSPIMPLCVFNQSKICLTSWVAEAIRYAADNGAQVINLSLGGYSFSNALNDAVQYAYQKGCVVIAAAGNNGNSILMYPAACENVIGVAAVDAHDAAAYYSNFNAYVDICAPGGNGTTPTNSNIYSTIAANKYDYKTGTSMAAPFVSGAAALLFSVHPAWTNAQVTEKLLQSADDLGPAGRDDYYGWGRLNIYKALNTTPAAPNNLLAKATTGGIDLTWSANSESDISYYKIFRRQDGAPVQLLAQIQVGTTHYNDSSTQSGHSYEYSLSAVDMGELESLPSGPVSVLSLSHELPAGISMISLPFFPADDQTLNETLGLTDPKIAQWDSTGQTLEYLSTASNRILPGQGFFIETPTACSINTERGSTVPLEDFSISLAPGWNQIGHPFLTVINWKEVKIKDRSGTVYSLRAAIEQGLLGNGLWKYEHGSYELTISLEPWLGYWVKANQTVTLIIPPANAGNGMVTDNPVFPRDTNSEEWMLRLSAAVDSSVADHSNYFGVSKDTGSSNSHIFDIEEPPVYSETINGCFTAANRQLAADIRYPSDSDQVWDFKVVQRTRQDKITLELENIVQLPEAFNCYLTDRQLHHTVNLRTNPIYSFAAVPDQYYYFQIRVTRLSLSSALDITNVLNCPNPFDPLNTNTNIKFTLSKTADVTLRIFNSAGTPVYSVNLPNLADGDRTTTWDGKDSSGEFLANGIYFYLITARDSSGNEKTVKEKIALWK